MQLDTPEATARHAITSVLRGNAPNGTRPADCGAWAESVQAVYDGYTLNGTQGARKAWDTIARAFPAAARLVAEDPAPIRAAAPQATDAMPELPASARLPEGLGDSASPWLNAYIEHSRYWSPRSFDDFHEAIGVWLLSTIAARRVVTHLGKRQYTPLFIALAGRSSVHAKTTAAEIGIDVLRDAGLDWLLADDNATPQKFIKDRTQRLPDGYADMQPDQAVRARLRLAFAGQCGWWYDEFGMLLHSMARSGSAMGDFSGLLRRFDDCAPSYTSGTISRATDTIVLPYLALLASLTPADLRPLMKRGSSGWSDGFWPRWAFVTPPAGEFKTDRFPAGERHTPSNLITTLRDWHHRLGTPDVAIDKDLVTVGPLPVQVVSVSDAVIDAFYTYGDAVSTLVMNSRLEELDSWHSRLSGKALRIAMLLASLENRGIVEMPHWARAQAITERWRGSLHRLYLQVNTTQEVSVEAAAEDQVLEVITRLGSPTIRDMKTRIASMSAGEIKEHADKLTKAGLIEAVQSTRSVRYRLPTTEETTSSAL